MTRPVPPFKVICRLFVQTELSGEESAKVASAYRDNLGAYDFTNLEIQTLMITYIHSI